MPPDEPVYRDPIDPLPNGLVRPKGERKVSKRRKRADQVKIAAALGKGGALREIAEDVGLSKTMVVHVRDKIDAGKDKYLAEVRKRAQDELAKDAIDVLKLNIEKQRQALNGTPLVNKEGAAILDAEGKPITVPPRLSDMAQSARALNEIAFPLQDLEPLRAPLGDIAKMSGGIAAELLLKLKEHEEKNARPEKEVEGERID